MGGVHSGLGEEYLGCCREADICAATPRLGRAGEVNQTARCFLLNGFCFERLTRAPRQMISAQSTRR